MSANDKLLGALTAALSPDNATRTAAEATLNDLSVRSGFFLALCDFICNATGQLPQRIRLMAASVAKQMIPKSEVTPLHELQEVVAKLRAPMMIESDRKVASQIACVLCKAAVAILTFGSLHANGGVATESNDGGGYSVLNALLTDVLVSLQDGVSPLQQHNSVVLISELLQAIQNLASSSSSSESGEALMQSFSSVRPQILSRLMYIAFASPHSATASTSNSDDVALVAARVARDVVLQGIAEDAAMDEQEQQPLGKRHKRAKKKKSGEEGSAVDGDEGDAHNCEASGTASIIREFSSQVIATMASPCRKNSVEWNERIVLATALVNDLVTSQYCVRAVVTEESVSQLLSSLQRDSNVVRQATESYDGDDASIVKVAAQRWELLSSLLAADRSLGATFARAVGSSYAEFTNMCVWHALVSDQIADEWIADANKFLQQEEEREDEVLWTLRDSAGSVCQAAAPYLGVAYVQTVLSTINNVLSLPLSEQGGQGSASSSWKERECVLFLLEMLVSKQWAALQASGFTDVASIFNILLSVDVTGPPVLASRALSLLAGILQKLKVNGVDITPQFNLLTPSCIASLCSEQPLLRACACRLQYRLLKYIPQGVASSFFADGFTQTLAMASLPGTFAELLYLALETADVWLSKCRENVAEIVRASGPNSPLAHAPETVVSLWQRHVQDPNVGELIVDILKRLLRVPECDASLCSCLGWMDNVLNGRATMAEFCTAPYIVELLSEVFHGASDYAATAVANATMGSLCSLLLTTEETSIISSASICLGSLLRRCPQPSSVEVVVPASAVHSALSQVSGPVADANKAANEISGEGAGAGSAPPTFAPLDEEGRPFPLTTALTAISLTILSPERSELSLMNVGSFLSEVARNAPNFSDGDIRLLIISIATRLNTARTDSVIQELIQPLSILLQCHQDAFLSVLNAQNLMQPFFSFWLPRAWSFFGAPALHQQAATLASFLTHWPSGPLGGQMLMWKDPMVQKKKRSGVAIPLNVAVFASLCKTTIALFDQESAGDDDDDDEEDDESEDELWQEGNDDSGGSATDDSDAEQTQPEQGKGMKDPNDPQSPYVFLNVIKQFAGLYSQQAAPLLSSHEQKRLLTLCT